MVGLADDDQHTPS
jgi:hypothetical protein